MNKKSKTIPFIVGLLIGAPAGGILGIFVISPVLLLLLSVLGVIKGNSLPQWAGTLVSFTTILSVNIGIYICVKWRLKAAGNVREVSSADQEQGRKG